MSTMSTITQRPDGTMVVNAKCRECDSPLTLPCHFDDGRTFEPDDFAMKWADMLICNGCAGLLDERRQTRERTGELVERIRAARIPASFRGLRFEDLDRSGKRGSIVAAAWAWADAPAGTNAGMLLWGPPGTGKTRLAATAVWRRAQRLPVTWCSVAHVISVLSAAFSDRDRQIALAHLNGNTALVLDDLDKVPASERVLSQLFVAIDRRIQAGSPLLVTANTSPHKLSQAFGAAIASRLLGYCKAFQLDGPDRRLR